MKQLLFLICLFLTQDCLFAQQQGSLMSGGINRTFRFHLPAAGVQPNSPLLICYHGTGGTGAGMENLTGFDAVSDQQNFIVVYPDGVTIGGSKQWNVYADDLPGHAGVGDNNAPDDVLFTQDLIQYFTQNYQVDCKRVYATGLSNGAFMCYYLALAIPNKIAAIAPVAGLLWGDNNYINSFTNQKMPVFHVHGVDDNVVSPPNLAWPYPMFLFMSKDGCDPAMPNALHSYPNLNQNDQLFEDFDYPSNCNTGTDYIYVYINGLGHAWPQDADFNTPLEIWNFVEKYQSNCVSSALQSPELSGNFKLYPNPNKGNFTLEIPQQYLNGSLNITVLDMFGREVYSLARTAAGESLQDIQLGSVRSGCYIVSLTDGQGLKTLKLIVE